MREGIRNIMSRLWPRWCERVLHDLHHLGIAITPVICSRLFMIALLCVVIFFALAAIEVLISEA